MMAGAGDQDGCGYHARTWARGRHGFAQQAYPEGSGGGRMLDNGALKRKMQAQSDRMGLSGEEADQLVRELNFFACLIIEAATQRRLDD